MAQGDNKTGQKWTNSTFDMTHDKIFHALRANKKFTYANPVVDHCPQKTDPNRISITAEGNLIKYDQDLLVPTADIDMAKLHWNSLVSTPLEQYMCINVNTFYLTAALEYFAYMKISMDLSQNGLKISTI